MLRHRPLMQLPTETVTESRVKCQGSVSVAALVYMRMYGLLYVRQHRVYMALESFYVC